MILNHKTHYKIIEESIKIKNTSVLPSVIPENYLKNLFTTLKNKIKNFSLVKKFKLFESSNNLPTVAKLNKAEMTAIDSCLTAILKIVGRKDLIDACRANSATFLKSYKLNGGDFYPITKNNYKKLKKGQIIAFLNLKDFNEKNFASIDMKDFDPKIGVYTKNHVGGAAHFAVIYDPKNRIILHNTYQTMDNDGEPFIPAGTGLTLQLKQIDQKRWENPKDIYALDYNIIKKMKCDKIKINKNKIKSVLEEATEQNVPCKGIKVKKGFACKQDKNGFYITTHRARSKSYPSFDKIPMKTINFIDSTG